MTLSKDEVRKVALLARLELDESEIEKQAEHLNNLLDQFEKLQELDVEGIVPTSHSMPVYNVFREDEVHPSLSQSDTLANAPESRDGFFIVPRIIE